MFDAAQPRRIGGQTEVSEYFGLESLGLFPEQGAAQRCAIDEAPVQRTFADPRGPRDFLHTDFLDGSCFEELASRGEDACSIFGGIAPFRRTHRLAEDGQTGGAQGKTLLFILGSTGA